MALSRHSADDYYEDNIWDWAWDTASYVQMWTAELRAYRAYGSAYLQFDSYIDLDFIIRSVFTEGVQTAASLLV